MTIGGEIILGCVLLVLAMQIVQLIRSNRTEGRYTKLESRVTKIEKQLAAGEIDRGTLVAFRAEVADKIAKALDPLHEHLGKQDRLLAEIKAAVVSRNEARHQRISG